MIIHIVKLCNEEFFSNKNLNTLKIISEMCATGEPIIIFLDY